MANLTGQGLADYAISKIGTAYVYGAKMELVTLAKITSWANTNPNVYSDTYIAKCKKTIGKIAVDCSGLIGAYREKQIGSSQLYSTAKEKHSFNRLSFDADEIPVGAVLWRNGHVGVYVGDGYCVEAKGVDYGTVKSKVSSTTFTYWLLFSDITYTTVSSNTVTSTSSSNSSQPIKTFQQWMNSTYDKHIACDNKYSDAVFYCVVQCLQKEIGVTQDGQFGANSKTHWVTLKKGQTSNSVKLVQGLLYCYGYALDIDGVFGSGTYAQVKKYQSDNGLSSDGVVGKDTAYKMLRK